MGLIRRMVRSSIVSGLVVGAAQSPADEPVSSSAQSAPASQKVSVRPGINDAYRDADIDQWVERFETDNREVYRERTRIVADLGLKPGMAVADVGAGTGAFTELLAEGVGPAGLVYAVDITPEFVQHIETRMKQAGRGNVRALLCTADSTQLAPASVDLALLCDTYHHLEYPSDTLRSLFGALRAGGTLVVVDFERLEGVSSDWTLEHVRAGRDVVIAEIAKAGFELVERHPRSARLLDNYVLRFRKKP